jgi:Family of unknown function (DUF6266)
MESCQNNRHFRSPKKRLIWLNLPRNGSIFVQSGSHSLKAAIVAAFALQLYWTFESLLSLSLNQKTVQFIRGRYNSNNIDSLISDLAYVAVYNEELKRWVLNPQIAARNAGTCTLEVTAFSGKPVQTYTEFMSADRKKVSKL